MCAISIPPVGLQRIGSQPPMNDFSEGNPSSEPLAPLVRETCVEPVGSPKRQRGLTKIIRALNGKLWHTYDAFYPDALQQTWVYFCRNLCEATTASRPYDPEVAKLTTWLNSYLKRRLQDFRIAQNQQRATTVSSAALSTRSGEKGNALLDPVDRLPAPADIPPWLEQVRSWAETDADGSLSAAHVSKHPTVTAQLLILKRLPPETPWKDLSAEYGISVGTLSSFYQRQCLKRLRAFGQSQGYF
ncbi:MAG: sigma-70 family RNA polymerase sigma factor [Cyanobacteria bacterium J06650_10]